VPASQCAPSALLDAQVSNDQVAGSSASPVEKTPATQPLDVLDANVVGTGEPTPIGVVLVHTTGSVAKVVLTLKGGGTDEMTPTSEGYAILAHGVAGLAVAPPSKPVDPPSKPVAPPANGAPNVIDRAIGLAFPDATVTAYDASGKQVGSITIPSVVPATPPCYTILPATPAPAGGSAPAGAPTSVKKP
jgi:hypothetical protein